jgi:acetyltransferase-like isoleucine patch superfamily enzyme
MNLINRFILNLKKGKTPLHRLAGSVLRAIFRPVGPRIPRTVIFLVPLRVMYELHYFCVVTLRSIVTICYRSPLFQARCSRVGANLSLDSLPFVSGHVQIEVGDNVFIGGKVAIISGGILESPRLILGNGAELGWNVSITVNKEVVIEDHARVAFDCRISDSDAHPREADLRAANKQPRIEDIKPVRICRNAWIGNGAHIMKGVTIGEGAIIGANSVVISDVPPFCMAAGNPARVYLKDFGRPSTFQQPETS